ncbi:MAG: GNAT family N-acetyltransferase [Silicimonas sp.]|nr:GNAT family N-acetyltransferase [Silicimonas sp.]NNL34654.1 GNAT family N-acetyltransferase [Silicimonas sp.]
MSIQAAGTEIPYTVTYLEMEARPTYDWPHLPAGSTAALLKAESPPVWWFLALYDAVGRDYAWEDIHTWEHDEIAEWLQADVMSLYTLLDHGWPQGFFLLSDGDDGLVNMEYFGMVPEAVGRGLGRWLLKTAVLTAWDRPGAAKLTVNTCTLDHPRALALYQKVGFTPVRREDKIRRLTRDRDLTRIPE